MANVLMNKLLELISALRHLSVDVAIGAWLSGNMAAKLLEIPMPVLWQWILPAATLFVYNLDHHLDAIVLKDRAISPRHRFHVRHLLAIRLGLVALGGACLAGFWLPLPMVLTGVAIGGLTVLHLGLVAWAGNRAAVWLVKEAGVAMVYTAGIWGPIISLNFSIILSIKIFLILIFFILVFISLLIFSLYDLPTDTQQEQTSVVQAWGSRLVVRIIWVLTAIIFILLIFLITIFFKVVFIYSTMALFQLWLATDRARFLPNDRYRWLGELVFWLPGLMVG